MSAGQSRSQGIATCSIFDVPTEFAAVTDIELILFVRLATAELPFCASVKGTVIVNWLPTDSDAALEKYNDDAALRFIVKVVALSVEPEAGVN